jgi:hypothetical protein
MDKKILKKLEKKLDKLDSLHEKEEEIISDIREMIDEEENYEEDDDYGED